MKRLVASFKRYVKYYLLFWKFAFNLQFAYRFDTFVILFSILSYNLLDFLFYKVTMNNIPALGGWTTSELFVLLSVSNLFLVTAKILYENNFETTSEKINSGDFDFYLLKPISNQFLSFFFPPDFIKVNLYFVVFILFGIAIRSNDTLFDLVNAQVLIAFFLSIVISLVLNYCLSLMVVSMSFHADRVDQVLGLFENMHEFLRYPLEVFHGFFRLSLGLLIPFGLLSGIPTKILLGKVDNVSQTLIQYFCLTIVFVIISQLAWKAGLRRYSSASS